MTADGRNSSHAASTAHIKNRSSAGQNGGVVLCIIIILIITIIIIIFVFCLIERLSCTFVKLIYLFHSFKVAKWFTGGF